MQRGRAVTGAGHDNQPRDRLVNPVNRLQVGIAKSRPPMGNDRLGAPFPRLHRLPGLFIHDEKFAVEIQKNTHWSNAYTFWVRYAIL